MENTTQQPKAPATIVDIRSLELPPAKFQPEITPDGRIKTLHTVAKFEGIGVRIGKQAFTYKSPKDDVPAYMNVFASNLLHVHVFGELNPDTTIDGTTPLDVEVAAMIFRGANNRMVDGHVYITVRRSKSQEPPTEVLTMHHVNELPQRLAGAVYRGRLSAVAIRPVPKKAAPASEPPAI